MPTESPLPQNDPMLIAFQKLKHTPEYANAVNWSLQAKSPSDMDGELWFAFSAGYTAGLRDITTPHLRKPERLL